MAYELGDVVMKCKPFAYVVSMEVSGTVCDHCLKQSKAGFKRCSTCKLVRYCGTGCQRASWPLHRDECKYLRRVYPKVPPDTVRLMARILIRMRCGAAREFENIPDGSKRGFEDLMSHTKKMVLDEKRMEAFCSYFEVLRTCLEDLMPSLQKSDAFDVFGRVLINSFNVMDDEYRPLGIGLYLAASVLDHSCRPNATVAFGGKELQVRCISPEGIEEFKDVRISYTNLLNDVEKRREDLAEQYYFRCSCEGCILEDDDAKEAEALKTGSICCSGCSHGVTTARRPICARCGTVQDGQSVKKAEEVRGDVRKFIFENDGGHPEPMEQSEEFYGDMRGLVHPCDKHFLPILENLSERYIREEKWKEAYEVCRLLLVAYKRLYPKYDINTALLLLKQGKLASYLQLDGDASECLDEAKCLIRVTHGHGHKLYSEVLADLLARLKVG